MMLSVRPTRLLSLDSPPSNQAIGLAVLREAAREAEELGLERGQLGLTPLDLKTLGVAPTDLRELERTGLIEPADSNGAGKSPWTSRRLVLSEAGLRHTAGWPPAPGFRATAIFQSLDESISRAAVPVPQWNPEMRELWWHSVLIKKFNKHAPTQELILAAFQEQSWLRKIDDPLPRVHDKDPAERLGEAVRKLNGKQSNPFLLFERDGTGKGVRWSVRPRALKEFGLA